MRLLSGIVLLAIVIMACTSANTVGSATSDSRPTLTAQITTPPVWVQTGKYPIQMTFTGEVPSGTLQRVTLYRDGTLASALRDTSYDAQVAMSATGLADVAPGAYLLTVQLVQHDAVIAAASQPIVIRAARGEARVTTPTIGTVVHRGERATAQFAITGDFPPSTQQLVDLVGTGGYVRRLRETSYDPVVARSVILAADDPPGTYQVRLRLVAQDRVIVDTLSDPFTID